MATWAWVVMQREWQWWQGDGGRGGKERVVAAAGRGWWQWHGECSTHRGWADGMGGTSVWVHEDSTQVWMTFPWGLRYKTPDTMEDSTK